MGSNQCRIIPLLGIVYPVEGKLFQIQGVFGKTTLIIGRFLRRKLDCGFDIYFVKHVLEILILIYVRIKSDVITLKTIVI